MVDHYGELRWSVSWEPVWFRCQRWAGRLHSSGLDLELAMARRLFVKKPTARRCCRFFEAEAGGLRAFGAWGGCRAADPGPAVLRLVGGAGPAWQSSGSI